MNATGNITTDTNPILLKINEQFVNWVFKVAGYDTATKQLQFFYEHPETGEVKKIYYQNADLNSVGIG